MICLARRVPTLAAEQALAFAGHDLARGADVLVEEFGCGYPEAWACLEGAQRRIAAAEAGAEEDA